MINITFEKGVDLPPFWLESGRQVIDIRNVVSENLQDLERNKDKYQGNLFQDALRIKWEDEQDWFTLPLDPIISITGKNIIIRRNVLKLSPYKENRRGSIKEIWSQDDYEVTIAGVFTGKNDLPEGDLRRLRAYCEARKTIMVESKLFTIFKITKLLIEDYNLPFTKGIQNQMYTLKTYSDDVFELLVKEEKK